MQELSFYSKICFKAYSKQIAFLRSFLAPLNAKAYLVGGCVRDALLGKKCNDFDVELYGVDIKVLDAFMRQKKADLVGKSFFVYKYKNYDFALARCEFKTGKGHTGFKVEVCHDEKEGARRRDFTINSLMFCIKDACLYDFYGGVKDLENKLLRCVDEACFVDDALRVLRAVQFVARFGLKIDQKSLNLMQKMSLDELSFERIRQEMYKFFKAQNLARGLFYIQKLGLQGLVLEDVTICNDFYKLLIKARKNILDEGLFLYLYLNYFDINKDRFFAKLGYKNTLKLACKQPYFSSLTPFILCQIAQIMPIKSYLGAFCEKDILLAKRLDIYNTRLKIKINPKKFQAKNKELGMLIKEEQNMKIKSFVEEKLKENLC